MGIAFIPNPENKPCINHKDGIKTNFALDNLEWCTYSENELHSINSLGKMHSKGESQGRSKLKEKQVYNIKNMLYKSDLPQKEIAERFRVSDSVISNIKHKVTWRHL